MSRCFPYIPPGIIGLDSGGSAKYEAAAGSIKPQKERTGTKERKTDKKREKERRHKSKELHESLQHTDFHHKKRKYYERGQLDEKDNYKKGPKGATEQLEKSNLTEENGLPYSPPDRCDSPDGTQDSSKGKKLARPVVSRTNRGLVLRIKLPLQKEKNVEPPAYYQPFSLQTELLEKHTDSLLQKLRGSAAASSSEPCVSSFDEETYMLQRHQCWELPASSERPCFSGRITEPRDGTSGNHLKPVKRIRSRGEEMERRFKELIVNWNPPQVQFEDSDISDQEWLFMTKKRDVSCGKSCMTSTANVPDHGNSKSLLQPRARFMSEFDTNEMPYVFLF